MINCSVRERDWIKVLVGVRPHGEDAIIEEWGSFHPNFHSEYEERTVRFDDPFGRHVGYMGA